MKQLLLLPVLMLAFVQTPQVNNGVIEGRVTRPGSSDGISDVQITLVGPSPIASASSLGSLYTPNPALTPAMREQIDSLINSAGPAVSLEAVANAAKRLEAQLLGLPAPPVQNTNATASQPQQTAILTDAGGSFAFRNLAPGRYQLRAQRDGYFGLPSSGVAPSGTVTIVTTIATVVAGQPTAPVTIEMLRGTIVSGRVRDPNGQPLQTTQVGAFQIDYQNGRKILRQMNLKQTDDRGEYRIFWLPPGDYMIATTPRRLAGGPLSAQDNYARTFFPNAIDGRDAQIIHAAEGAEISGIDIGVRPDATGRISGKVVTSFTQPNGQSSNVSIFYLISTDPSAIEAGVNSIPSSSSNRTNGQFELRGIVPGQYELLSSAPSSGLQIWGRTRVNVNAAGLSDVVLDIHPGIEVKARLSVDGAAPAYTMQTPPLGLRGQAVSINGVLGATSPGSPVAVPQYRVQLRSAEGFSVTPPFENAVNQNVTYDPAGVFVFPSVLEGKYSINVSALPSNGYIADVKVGGTSVFDSGFDVNSQTGEVQIFVNTNGGKVQGRVVDASQRPFASARVALVPRESRRQNVQLYKSATSDASGNFTINGVAPGDYKLFAWEAVPNTAWMNPEFLAPYEGRGLSITVSPTGLTPATIDLRVIPKL